MIVNQTFFFLAIFCVSKELIGSLFAGDEEQEGDQKLNLAPTCIALAIFVVLVALCSNLIAFLLFYKKPVFRKILSNR